MKSGSFSSTKALRANLFRLRPSQFHVRQLNSDDVFLCVSGVSASDVVAGVKFASTTGVELSLPDSLKRLGC